MWNGIQPRWNSFKIGRTEFHLSYIKCDLSWIEFNLGQINKRYVEIIYVKTVFHRPPTFWPQMYRHLPLTILHLCIKYENYSSNRVRTKVLTKFFCDLNIWPFDPKMHRCLSPTILHLILNMKAVPCNLLKLSCQNKSVDKVQLWLWPLTFWPQNVKVSSSHHPASLYEI